MEELPGQRPGSRIFFLGEYSFHLDSRYRDTPHKYYRCATRTTSTQCTATIYVPENGQPVADGEHNHPSEPNYKDDCLFRQIVKDLAADISLNPDEILRQASIRMPASGERCSVPATRSFIKRIRSHLVPPVPRTVADLGNALIDYAPTQDIYRGSVRSGGAFALIFASLEMLVLLNRATWLHIDGTFSVVPRTPNADQLWIIFIREGDKGYAAVFVLCERRTKGMYDAIWRFLINLCPDLQVSLRGVWTDFERGAIQSIRQFFPRVRIHGCWFHFCRAVYRKWKSLRMPNPPMEILYLAWNLALLPAHRFVEGCRVITDIADPLAVGSLRPLNDFCHYLRNQWVPLAAVASVYGTPIRTNNVAEAFNRYATKRLGGVHPAIWIFLDKLLATIKDELTKFRRWRTTGENTKRPVHKAWVRADDNIANHHRLLDTGRYGVEEFLRAVTTPYQRQDLHYASRSLPADGAEEHELPSPEEILNPPDVYPDDPQDPALQRRRPRDAGLRDKRCMLQTMAN